MLRYGTNIIEYLGCRPGLTGLWQVSGRNDVSYRRRVALDTYYATHWSLGLDLLILLKTAGVVLNRSGAY
jgi:lipopolysaccharide/colanic/teichoic acid biosynthesis glycosyltransferase